MGTNTTYHYGHNSQETAKIVNDYPYGRKLRTTKRYWIETKENYGQRLATQTINPKNGRWNKPKHSTYTDVAILFETDGEKNNGEKIRMTSYAGISSWAEAEKIKKFWEKHKEQLDEYQVNRIKMLLAAKEVSKHIKVTIKPSPMGKVDLFDREKQQKEKQKAFNEKVKKALAYEYQNVELT